MSGETDKTELFKLAEKLVEVSIDGQGAGWVNQGYLHESTRKAMKAIGQYVHQQHQKEWDSSLGASIERVRKYNAGEYQSNYNNKKLEEDWDRVLEAADRWESKTSKPFPWDCTCGHSFVPDQKYFTCKKCNTEWGNPWYEPEQKSMPEGWAQCLACTDQENNSSCLSCRGTGRTRIVVAKKPEKIRYEAPVWFIIKKLDEKEAEWGTATAGELNQNWSRWQAKAWTPKTIRDGNMPPSFLITWMHHLSDKGAHNAGL